MAWNQNLLATVSAELRQSAAAGRFTPFTWVEKFTGSGSNSAVHGCGWGIIGWLVAVAMVDSKWARSQLPVGTSQGPIDALLRTAGLTNEEIDLLDVPSAWEHFDEQLQPLYADREKGVREWDAYIAKSLDLAEFFIEVLNRVPVDETMRKPPKALVKLKHKLQSIRSDSSDYLDEQSYVPVFADDIKYLSVDEAEPVALAA